MLVPLFFLLNNKLPRLIYIIVLLMDMQVYLRLMARLFIKNHAAYEHGIYSREREEEIIKSTWAKDISKICG